MSEGRIVDDNPGATSGRVVFVRVDANGHVTSSGTPGCGGGNGSPIGCFLDIVEVGLSSSRPAASDFLFMLVERCTVLGEEASVGLCVGGFASFD